MSTTHDRSQYTISNRRAQTATGWSASAPAVGLDRIRCTLHLLRYAAKLDHLMITSDVHCEAHQTAAAATEQVSKRASGLVVPRTGVLSSECPAAAGASVSRVSRHALTHLDNVCARFGQAIVHGLRGLPGAAALARSFYFLGAPMAASTRVTSRTSLTDHLATTSRHLATSDLAGQNRDRWGAEGHGAITNDQGEDVAARTVAKDTWMGSNGALKVGSRTSRHRLQLFHWKNYYSTGKTIIPVE